MSGERTNMTKILRLILLSLLASSQCFAQSAEGVPGIPLSGTITSTGAFQLIQGVNTGRDGCEIQNTSSDTQYLFLETATNDPTCANATIGRSAELLPAQPMKCRDGYASVNKEQICITGTAGDTFFANFQ
jgi:hypothetical protein